MFFNKRKKEKTPAELQKQVDSLQEKSIFLEEEIERIKKESDFVIQKTSIIRYNPFSNIGGNQSFSAAFLDKKGNGIVITSLYAREGNRVYAKPIKNNKSEYTLSKEEEKVIKLCQKK